MGGIALHGETSQSLGKLVSRLDDAEGGQGLPLVLDSDG